MKNTLKNISLAGMSAICLLLASQFNASAEEKGTRGQLSASDFKFVSEAAQGGRIEVSLGQLAARKATDPAVRQFGERMVQDHQKANQELTQLAARKGATLPDSAKKENETLTHFQSLSGSDFDKAYVKDMLRDHKKDVKEFQKESTEADDADLKSWVAKTLPTLQEHLSTVQDLDAKKISSK